MYVLLQFFILIFLNLIVLDISILFLFTNDHMIIILFTD